MHPHNPTTRLASAFSHSLGQYLPHWRTVVEESQETYHARQIEI
jgi:hypothetical protein